jgi:hypothetical protein
MAAGTITLASNHMEGWGWVITAPVALFMLYLLVRLT